MVHSPFLVFCTVFVVASYTSVYTFTFFVLFFHAFCCQPSSLIVYCEKGCKKDYMNFFFDHVSYPYYTVLRNKAGIEKAGFRKPVVRESCQTGTANCNFIEYLKEMTMLTGQRKLVSILQL